MPVLLALLAGTMLPVQAAINAPLGRSLGGAVWAATISGAVLTVALGAAALVTARGLPRTEDAGSVPWWPWVGGCAAR